MNQIFPILEGGVILAAPLIFAACAGLLSERSGVIDIGLEGKMLIATVFTVLVAYRTNNPAFGILAGVLASCALSLTHWLLTQHYRIDHIVSGMAVNSISLGATEYVAKMFLDPGMTDFAKAPLQLFWFVAIVLPFALHLYVRRTRGGLRLMAIGHDPDKSRQMGLEPLSIRLKAAIVNGLLCGVAGALLVTNTGSYENGMTAGKGFIALAALIVGGWRPLSTMAACLAIGLLQQLRISFMGQPVLGVEIPTWAWISLPYLVTIIMLAGFLGKVRAPEGLGRP